MQITVRDDPTVTGYYVFARDDVFEYLIVSDSVKEFSKRVAELVKVYRLEKLSKDEFAYIQRGMSLHSILTTRNRDMYLSVYRESV